MTENQYTPIGRIMKELRSMGKVKPEPEIDVDEPEKRPYPTDRDPEETDESWEGTYRLNGVNSRLY